MMRQLFLCCMAIVGLLLWSAAACAAPIDLAGLGINADFETPSLGGDDGGEQYNNGDLGSGWTKTLTPPSSSEWGLVDPPTSFYGAQNPLPAPFDGRQTAYMNLSRDSGAVSEVVSDPIGTLGAGEVYTLSVGAGTRFAASVGYSASWAADAVIGLELLDGTDLGTFAVQGVSGSANALWDVQYTLDVDADAPGAVGQQARIVIRGVNTTTDQDGFSQLAFDNVRLDVTAVPEPASLVLLIAGGLALLTLRRRG